MPPPNSFNMYVTVDEEGSDAVLEVYLAGDRGPLNKATVEYELFTGQGVPLGIVGEMKRIASGVWCSPPLPLAENMGEVCALVQANPQGYPLKRKDTISR